MTELYSHSLIVGAGFSGVATAIKHIKEWNNPDFHIYDRDSAFGGTWKANTYPGCASDVPAIFYCLASDPKIDWSHMYPFQEELFQYFQDVAAKYGLPDKSTLNTEIVEMRWNEKSKEYTTSLRNVKTGATHTHRSKVVFVGRGCLVAPNKLNLPGLDTFKGPVMHTARWDHKNSIVNKNVVVVGHGCSAVQVVADIAPKCKTLTQFARSPQWIIPRIEKILHPGFMKFLSYIPGAVQLTRIVLFFLLEYSWTMFSGAWWSKIDNKIKSIFISRWMRSKVPAKYHDVIVPKFSMGCKRTIFDPGYLKQLSLPTMELSFDPIVKVKEHSVVSRNGLEYQADVIVDATGFDIPKSISGLKIVGENGVELDEFWNGRVSAYETVQVPNFPNLFFIFGPNALTGHNSVTFAIDNSLVYVDRVARDLVSAKPNCTYVSVSEKAYDKWVDEVQDATSKTTFGSGGCASWYLGANKYNATTYPWTQIRAWWHAHFPNQQDIIRH